MNHYTISSEDSRETVILKCVEIIFDLEAKKNGLTREEVIDKYTHGLCSHLAQAIKDILDRCGKTGAKTEHFSVSASHDMLTTGSTLKGDKLYFDICGQFDETTIDEHLASLTREVKFPHIYEQRHDLTCINAMYNSIALDGQMLFGNNRTRKR